MKRFAMGNEVKSGGGDNPSKPETGDEPTLLIIYFSYSGQVRRLVDALAEGVEEAGVGVGLMRLKPQKPLPFPLSSVFKAFSLMIRTFFRERYPVQHEQPPLIDPSLVMLAGPTWSFNPSGPMLAWLDEHGCETLASKKVLPLISCRTYWKGNASVLGRMAGKCGATVLDPVVFGHPLREPWRSLGVFLALAGKRPERIPLVKKHYPSYGHSHSQVARAKQVGRRIGRALAEGEDLAATARWLHERWIEHGTP